VATGNNGGPLSVTIPYSSRVFYLYNNQQELANKTVSSSCVSGTTWNGSTCQASTAMSGTLTPASPSCSIAAGGNGCNVSLTWTTTNPAGTSAVTSDYPSANTVVASGNSGSTSPFVPHAGRTFYLYNNTKLLATSVASAICSSGTTWNGSACLAPLSGTLIGTVRDSSTNKVIPGASIAFNGINALSNLSGAYTLTDLACASATMIVDAVGYKSYSTPFSLSPCPGTTTKDVALAPVLSPTVSYLRADPSQVASGKASVISWSVIGATSVTLGSLGAVPAQSSTTVTPFATTTYTLTASNPFGASTADVTVRVDPPLQVFISGTHTTGTVPFESAFQATPSGGLGPYTYKWSSGASGPSATFQWPNAGSFQVTCTLVDSHGTSVVSNPVRVTATASGAGAFIAIYDHTASPLWTQRRTAVAADGRAELAIVATTSRAGFVTFTLSKFAGSSFDARLDGGFTTGSDALRAQITLPSAASGGSYTATAIYRAPDDFASGQPNRSISAHFVGDDQSAVDSTPVAFDIVRPPLVLIHGIWSKSAVWDDYYRLVGDPRFEITRARWDGTSSLTTAMASVNNDISRALLQMRTQDNAAVERVDAVGHSMGGLIARALSISDDNIHKIITLNTPHFGSPLADYLYALKGTPWQAAFAVRHHSIGDGCIDDLRVTSPERTRAMIGQSAPSHTFVGVASHASACVTEVTKLVNTMCEWDFRPYRTISECETNQLNDLLGSEHDQVVSAASQAGGLGGLATDVVADCSAAHVNVIANDTFAKEVTDLLDASVTSPLFSRFQSPKATSGVRVTSVVPALPRVLTGLPVSITAPPNGAGVTAGARILVSVDAPGADRVAIVGPNDIVFSNNRPFEAMILIPQGEVGDVGIIALAFVGDAYASSAPLSLVVKPTADIQQILVEPAQIYLQRGRSLALATRGFFNDGSTRTLTSGSGVVYASSNTNVVSVDPDGMLQAVGSGEADVSATYGGERGTVRVFVTATDGARRRAARH